jgi:twitching motility protein PilT
VSQVLVRKAGGGRVAAREVLLNTPAIASLIADGRMNQLAPAVESGRKQGMVPLNDALAGFVQSGVVDVKDAYRQAVDRPAFLAVLRREGVDTSFAGRLA